MRSSRETPRRKPGRPTMRCGLGTGAASEEEGRVADFSGAVDDEDDGTAPIMRWWRRDSSESSARAMVDGWLDGLLVGARRRKNIKMNPPLGERENLREKRIVRRHA